MDQLRVKVLITVILIFLIACSIIKLNINKPLLTFDRTRNLEIGVHYVKKNEEVNPLADIFSTSTEETSKENNFYVTQEGTHFNFSNGYQLTLKNFVTMELTEESVFVSPSNSYGDAKTFLKSNFEDNDNYVSVWGSLTNNIIEQFKIYGLYSSTDEATYYKSSDVEKKLIMS